VAVDAGGSVRRHKTLSTPPNFDAGVLAGLAACCGGPLEGLASLLHASTVATNAILERRGPRTGLITTEGFRDVLEIGRLRYPRLYDLGWSRPEPLVERRLRLGVVERTAADGSVVRPLDEASVAGALDVLEQANVEAVAICLLNSYVNGEHEIEVERLVRERLPEAAVSRSSAVLPLIREYDRTSTTVINAYLQPVMGDYLGRLAEALQDAGSRAPILMLQSSGGVMPATEAAQLPAFCLESGPTAGVLAAAQLARQRGLDRVLAFDMGGTTAKAAVVLDGAPAIAPELELGGGISSGTRLTRGSGYLLRTPTIDLAEIGAGGGSIARVDQAGGLSVGPDSAGADPGPACYGRGGQEATLTDVNVVLGHVSPTGLLGGEMAIDADRAARAVAEHLAGPLGTDVARAADAARQVAAAELARALRAVTSERGVDPAAFTLVAFGGGGPGMAAAVADLLGIRRVLAPAGPGVFSATGLLGADLRWMATHSPLIDLGAPDSASRLDEALRSLRERCLALAAAGGYRAVELEIESVAECRYRGQSFEIPARIPDGRVTQGTLDAVRDRFEALHEAAYGHRDPTSPVIAAVLRVSSVRANDPVTLREALDRSSKRAQRRAWFEGRWRSVPVVRRGDLGRRPTSGPLIVEDYDATTVVPPGWRCAREADGALLLEAGR
jgi:N-methylhydantoinase A